MSDPLTGWLTLAKAPKDTTYGSNTKWDSLARANDVKRLFTTVDLPNFTFNNFGGKYLPFCRFAQYNYTTYQPFVIQSIYSSLFNNTEYPPTNTLLSGQSGGGLFGMMIRYRVGNSVKRYQVFPGQAQLPFWPFYTGQLIQQQFSIEFYSWQQADEYILDWGLSLTTSIPFIATCYGQAAPVIEPVGGLITNFQIPLGQPLPYAFDPAGPWNSN